MPLMFVRLLHMSVGDVSTEEFDISRRQSPVPYTRWLPPFIDHAAPAGALGYALVSVICV